MPQIIKSIQGFYESTDIDRKRGAYEELINLQFSASDLNEEKELAEYISRVCRRNYPRLYNCLFYHQFVLYYAQGMLRTKS